MNMIRISLAEMDAALLALLLKRLTFEDARRRAEDEQQAYAMLGAAERCRAEIAKAGG